MVVSVEIASPDADLFSCQADILVNPVNCVGVQGKGLALAFKQRFPGLDDFYRQACDAGDLRPGRPVLWRPADLLSPKVLLFATKRHWRDDSRLSDIVDGLAWMGQRLNASEWEGLIAMPALGCGLGGLDFEQVRQAVEDHLGSSTARVLLFPPQ